MVFLFIFLIMTSSCTAANNFPLTAAEDFRIGSVVIIRGKIAVKGNEPHTWLCLTNSDRLQFQLRGKLIQSIQQNFQQQTITLQGEITSEPKNYLRPTGFRVQEILKSK